MSKRESPEVPVPPLRLGRDHLERLSEHARHAYPHEACGLLIGRASPAATEVGRITLAHNLAVDRLHDRYLLDPGDFLQADRDARRDGLDVVGVWHTHPDHPARPSEKDLREAWPDFAYLILSVQSSVIADVTAWRLSESRFVPQVIEVIEVIEAIEAIEAQQEVIP